MTEFFKFPQDFYWGTATASYQIEGAAHEDGRKDSIWDVFSRTPGKVRNGDTGDVADDHYHRWQEDIETMKNLGVNAYRFSLSWPRIVPDGKGPINQAGIDFYNRVIDALLTAGIKPLVTLYHWDLPAALPGGWLNRDTAFAFQQFTEIVSRTYGDRVKDWITINEPFCASFLGYKYGRHAPGLMDTGKALTASHHILLAHGLSVPVIRANSQAARVGITLNQGPFYPVTQSRSDLERARHGDGELIRWFNDPVYGRYYPLDMLQDYVKEGAIASVEPEFIQAGDMEQISVPTDFLGLNYYTRSIVNTSATNGDFPDHVNPQLHPDEKHTEMGWEVFPFGLYETILRAYFTYKPREIIITENGASYSDGPDPSGRVRDERRLAYLQSHISSVARAIQAGVPVSGYYVWSLLDNFEWAYGYSQRFGIVHVDYQTLKRTIKDSATWYSKVVKENGLELS